MDDGISVALPAEARSVPVMRRIVGSALAARGITGDRAFRLLTAAAEACANIVEHGAEAGVYRVGVRVDGTDCRIDIVHEGPGFVPPQGRLPADDAESGRGVAMMRRLVDEVDFAGPPPGRTGSSRVLLLEHLPEHRPLP